VIRKEAIRVEWGLRLLSLSRLTPFVIVLGIYMASTAVREGQTGLLGLYAVSTAIYLTTTAIQVGWIPAPARVRRAAFGLETALAALLHWVATPIFPMGPMPVILAPLVVTVYVDWPRRTWLPLSALVLATWVVPAFGYLTEGGLAKNLLHASLYLALYFVFGAFGYLLRSLWDAKERSDQLLSQVRASESALARALRQVQETAHLREQAAVMEERQRLSREMHDSVAHKLTALLVQITAARRLLARGEGNAAEALAYSEEMAREALTETRRAVSALREPGSAGLPALLRRIAAEFGAATGMAVEVASGDDAVADGLESGAREHLCRIFQEALTNAHRHGEATRVRLALQAGDGRLQMIITNEGRAPTSLTPGVGLRSMAERAGLLGGSVSFEPGPAGLTVRVSVPLPEVSAGTGEVVG
jgi:signal transduction histidine kinase